MIAEQIEQNLIEKVLNKDYLDRNKITAEVDVIGTIKNRSKNPHAPLNLTIYGVEFKNEHDKIDFFYVGLFKCRDLRSGANYTVKQLFYVYPTEEFLERKFDFKV